MYLMIIILPLLASISSGFFGRKIGTTGAQLITTGSIMITTLLAIITFFEVGLNSTPISLVIFKWIDLESLDIFWGFNFDSLTVSMLIPVLIVSSLVHLYSIGYMNHDPHNQRFFSYLSLFTFMMIILVTANNFLLMFVGWEGVGICSYLLVSFWFTRIAANQSSMSAFLTNRVGDCFLTIGMFVLLWSFGNIDYSTVFSLSADINENIITIIGICLLIGAMAKSSQIGLHIWLPQAMEGPTPVSALIHAATMVTAGVYLLMRTSPLIEYSSTVLLLCMWIGAITTVFSSLVGLYQQDIKKVIAYSTMSQLGMMVIAVGLSSYGLALFHLVNHAFYKALLFLGAGAVIHSVGDIQDFRKYGGLKQFLPLTYSVMLIASFSLVAFPFMTGFYSKDLILESAFGQLSLSGVIVYFIATIGAMFTTLYSIKVLYLTFLANPASSLNNYKMAHESDIYMSIPLIILAFFSIFFGYFTKDIFIGLGTYFFVDNGVFIHPNHEIMIDTEFGVPTLFKLLPLFFTITLSLLSFILSEFFYKIIIYFKLNRIGYNIFSFFNQRFYIELFYNKFIVEVILRMGGQTTKILDKGSIELVGPYGLERGLIYLSEKISKLDTGIITNYALYILTGFIIYILVPYVNHYILIILLFGLFTLTYRGGFFSKTNTKINVNIESKLKYQEIIFNLLISLLLYIAIKLNINIFANNDLFGPYKDFIIYLTCVFTGIVAVSFRKGVKGQVITKWESISIAITVFIILLLIDAIIMFPVFNSGNMLRDPDAPRPRGGRFGISDRIGWPEDTTDNQPTSSNGSTTQPTSSNDSTIQPTGPNDSTVRPNSSSSSTSTSQPVNPDANTSQPSSSSNPDTNTSQPSSSSYSVSRLSDLFRNPSPGQNTNPYASRFVTPDVNRHSDSITSRITNPNTIGTRDDMIGLMDPRQAESLMRVRETPAYQQLAPIIIPFTDGEQDALDNVTEKFISNTTRHGRHFRYGFPRLNPAEVYILGVINERAPNPIITQFLEQGFQSRPLEEHYISWMVSLANHPRS